MIQVNIYHECALERPSSKVKYTLYLSSICTAIPSSAQRTHQTHFASEAFRKLVIIVLGAASFYLPYLHPWYGAAKTSPIHTRRLRGSHLCQRYRSRYVCLVISNSQITNMHQASFTPYSFTDIFLPSDPPASKSLISPFLSLPILSLKP